MLPRQKVADPSLTSGPPRRTFLAGLAALGAGALIYKDEIEAQTPSAAPHRIDVHHHFGPPTYVAALTDKGIAQRPVIEWTVAKSLDDMAEGCAMGIEVEQDIVWSVREVTPGGPDVEIDTPIFDHPKQRGLVLDERVPDGGACP